MNVIEKARSGLTGLTQRLVQEVDQACEESHKSIEEIVAAKADIESKRAAELAEVNAKYDDLLEPIRETAVIIEMIEGLTKALDVSSQE